MAVFERKGPLPDGHPLKGGLVIFGAKRPKPVEKESTEENRKENMDMSTTGQKMVKGNRSSVRELPADDPIYTHGFAVGEMRSMCFSKNTVGKTSPDSNEKLEQPDKSATQSRPAEKEEWDEFEFNEKHLTAALKKHKPQPQSD